MDLDRGLDLSDCCKTECAKLGALQANNVMFTCKKEKHNHNIGLLRSAIQAKNPEKEEGIVKICNWATWNMLVSKVCLKKKKIIKFKFKNFVVRTFFINLNYSGLGQ